MLKKHHLKGILENRIKAFMIDYLIMGIIGFLIVVLTDDLFLTMMIVYPITMNKDFLNGKSIGKRFFGIQVQNMKSQKASELKSALRNFLPIIPVDLVFTFITPTRRIGDRIAKTKIGFNQELNLNTVGSELKNYRINKELILGMMFGVVNIWGLLWLYNNMLP
ncbi:RDD family protein [Tenacibaculum sp. MAR_2009_124]|uniref:RDD family protein n=1 Tax=Tenacibaculum sp. MAR_2009_124 TaxID=1250059 RepID=UPI00089938B0|nr:RDD family protein [Tenacibaculum sp. MAR_2009_124]SEB87538.1 RDD family protein [Tenacibaculum sp. MAR_2009_124]